MSSNTLIPFELDFTDLDETKPYKDYRKELLDKLKAEGQRHFNYYDKLRAKRSPYVQSRRWLAAVLGALGAVLTAAGTALRVTQTGSDLDLYALVAAVLCYGLMSSISLYEKFTDTTSSYFRYLGILLGLRSLWTKLQFELAKEDPAPADEKAARKKLLELAQAFCTDVDKLASTEINEWKTEFLASLTEIEKAAESGSAAAQKQLEETAKALEKATQEFQKKAEELAKKAEPAYIKIECEGAEPPITLFVDDSQVAIAAYKQTGLSVMPGIRKIEARATKGTASVQGLDYVKAEPGTTHPLKLKLV